MSTEMVTQGMSPAYLGLTMKIIQIVALIIIGLVVASIAKSLIKKLLKVEKVKNFFDKLDGKDADENMRFVNIIAKLVYWLVLLIFIESFLLFLKVNF